MNDVRVRRYDLLTDYHKVYDFLVSTFDIATMNSYLLPGYWEYGHSHTAADFRRTARMGLWELDGQIVGIAGSEMWPGLGTAHLHTAPGYEHLLPDILDWAELELPEVTPDGRRQLGVWITDNEPLKQELLAERGYTLDETVPVKVFTYDKPFPIRELPAGFRMISGTEIDPEKLAEFWWYGFENQGQMTDDQIDFIQKLNCAPHGNPELTTVIVAPDGTYACALCMWVDEPNQFAYLEPMATRPEYRGLGLATFALSNVMQRTKEMGATICNGGPPEFYSKIGFQNHLNRQKWVKEYLR